MRKIAIIIIHLLLCSSTQAQLIENRVNIYLSYSIGTFLGTETLNENNYISPSLYSNYNKLSGFSVKGIINSKKNLSFGINYDYQTAKEWTSLDYSDFNGSEIQIHSITPIIRVHNKFNENGLSNKLLLLIECGPTIGYSNLSLSNPLFEIQTNESNSIPAMSDNNFIAGLKGTLGFEYYFAQSMGIFFSYSYNMNWVSSKFNNDKSIKNSLINIGLVLKFNKNKHFYY